MLVVEETVFFYVSEFEVDRGDFIAHYFFSFFQWQGCKVRVRTQNQFRTFFTGFGISPERKLPESELARDGLQLNSDSGMIPYESTKNANHIKRPMDIIQNL